METTMKNYNKLVKNFKSLKLDCNANVVPIDEQMNSILIHKTES